MKKIKNMILITIGSFFLLLGIIGIILPVVPTTPFLIVAGLCYINSSKKLYHKVINIKYFGPHVQNYVEKRELTKTFKISSLLFLWIPTAITVLFIVNNWYIRGISLSMAVLVSAHIFSLKTTKDNKIDIK